MAKDKKLTLTQMIDREIAYILNEMDSTDIDDESYTLMINRLDSLYDIRNKNNSWRIKPETVLMMSTNLLGIIIVLKHEEMNVITSKAFGLIGKGRG